MIVGSVTTEVNKRIEEYAAKTTDATASKAISDRTAGVKTSSEQNTNASKKGAAALSNGKPDGVPIEPAPLHPGSESGSAMISRARDPVSAC